MDLQQYPLTEKDFNALFEVLNNGQCPPNLSLLLRCGPSFKNGYYEYNFSPLEACLISERCPNNLNIYFGHNQFSIDSMDDVIIALKQGRFAVGLQLDFEDAGTYEQREEIKKICNEHVMADSATAAKTTHVFFQPAIGSATTEHSIQRSAQSEKISALDSAGSRSGPGK